ncbi:MAG: adenylate/guanylate cyclase domain-containing protein [Gammaproteobacteria bacterium]|nr:adenylate/guanylate cyclase domain-containing protein [Gammaproteobacteria bacterium]
MDSRIPFMALKTSNLAILFADISGSTHLYEVLGDEAARAKVAECLELLTGVIERHAGTVIKTIGDEIMCTFPSAETAASAACDMQETLHEEISEQTPGPTALAIRVGMHFGQAILEAGDVFGDAVNVAARMASMAKAGQIIASQSTIDELSKLLQANTRLIDRAPVKGKKESMDICEILWQQDDVTRMSTAVATTMPDNVARMRLDYHKLSIALNAERTQVVIGRSKTADIPVDEVLASRLHVRIEQRRGKFFIIDQSTNGTYVKIDNTEAFLRREEMPLSGTGVISLGRPFIENPTEIVHFSFDS